MFSSLYIFKDEDLENNNRERNIYDVLETSLTSNIKIGKYINSPIISKQFIWTPLGDYISSCERNCLNDIDPNAYYTIRLDGSRFSKSVIPSLVKNNILNKGYSVHFEEAIKYAQLKIFKYLPQSICSFSQSDEITVLVGPARIGSDGKHANFDNNGRFQKYISILSSLVSSAFSLSLAKMLVKTGKEELIEKLEPMMFDARIAQFDSYEAALQVILWRSYDCNVNGVSSGIHCNQMENKSKINLMNSTGKLNVLEEKGILDKMTDHQLYGTTLWKQDSNVFSESKPFLASIKEKDFYLKNYQSVTNK